MTSGLACQTKVIVESAAEARENDSDQKIKNKESERGKSMVELAVLCADLDKDASGTVSLDELFFGYDNLPQFKRLMEQMDIKRDELLRLDLICFLPFFITESRTVCSMPPMICLHLEWSWSSMC